ncbi:MAG: hypothetical protein IJU13_02615 [Bacteroidales bacterium]|nr:hypothetical protein [Bacteroidales bacterium]
MRRLIVLWAAFLLSVSLYAQTRMVRGMVVGENDAPLSGVRVYTIMGEETTTGPDGKFAFSVAFQSRSVFFEFPDFFKAEKEIDGSFLLIRMRVDKDAVARKEKARKEAEERARKEAERQEQERLAAERAAIMAAALAEKARLEAEEQARRDEEARLRAEAEAQAKAEREARLQAEREEKARLAAEEKARKEEEARIKAEAEAKAKAERERLAAEEKARKEEEARLKAEAEAKAKAEREARLQAEREEKARLAAEEKARKEEEARLKAEADAKAKAERKAANQAADKAYSERFKNQGFEHCVTVSYSYQLSKEDVAFVYSGFRDYGSTHPVELDYTLSYKFNRIVSLGVGVGVLYHLKSLSIVGDDYIAAYSSFREKQLDVPVFANLKIRMLRSRIRPLISLQAGCYCMSGVFYSDAGLGCEYRVNKRLAMHLIASVRTCPWPNFSEEMGSAKYKMSMSPCVKLGVSF